MKIHEACGHHVWYHVGVVLELTHWFSKYLCMSLIHLSDSFVQSDLL